MSALYTLSKVSRIFQGAGEDICLFHNLSFSVDFGETLAIVGASGSGKSTLLHLLGALDTPTSGAVYYDGTDLATMNERKRALFRNKELGFVYQFHHLLPEFTAEENVAMPGLVSGEPLGHVIVRAQHLLRRVGLGDRMQAKVPTLSGGERQRVAIARALLNRPRVVLADEPTGNLDARTGIQIEDLLLSLNAEFGTTLVIVTHNMALAKRMGRCMELAEGSLRPISA
ncbi:MAG: ABC transporter ATP-binding protein [Desulfovibrio sp.]|nr:ABC transporter ATP-binding protein [Desulfovibrio sp.]